MREFGSRGDITVIEKNFKNNGRKIFGNNIGLARQRTDGKEIPRIEIKQFLNIREKSTYIINA